MRDYPVFERADEKAPEFTDAHCNSCLHKTRHKVRSHVVQYFNDGDERWPVLGDVTYQMLECCGCSDVIFRKRIHLDDWEIVDLETGRIITDAEVVIYYPPAVSRPEPTWVKRLDKSIQSLIIEVYSALYSDSKMLAAMGTRAVLDMAIVEKVGDCGTFPQKLKALEDQGLISKDGRAVLEAALDAGSAAAHRGYAPSSDDLNLVMDIVEHVLEALYVLPNAASALKERTPQRRPTK